MKTQKSSKKSSKTNVSKPTNTSNAQGVKVTKTRTVGAHVPASQQCEHKSAKHHSRGKCCSCYNRARNSKAKKSVSKKKAVKKSVAK
jgi:hypothetical protein